MLSDLLTNVDFLIIFTGALVGIAAALPGVFLVLRGASMLTDAISHSIVLGIVLVWFATGMRDGVIMTLGAGAAGLLCVALTEALARTGRVKMDAAIGLVFPALFSIGVLLINVFGRDIHLDQQSVLLGEIGLVWLNTVNIGGYDVPQAIVAVGALALLNSTFVALFYKELKLATFDTALAHALGFMPGLIFYVLLALTSVTAVASFDAVGAVMFVAFVIVPPSTALLLSDRLHRVIAIAVCVAIASAISGYWLALMLNSSIGAMMASMTGAFFTLAFLMGPRHGMIALAIARRGQRRDNDCRALAVHLHHHEDGYEAVTECTSDALHSHLRWSLPRTRRVVLQSLDRELILRQGTLLELTQKGRAMAREVIAP
jgi:manganese/zinc/iron transport system permease protein